MEIVPGKSNPLIQIFRQTIKLIVEYSLDYCVIVYR